MIFFLNANRKYLLLLIFITLAKSIAFASENNDPDVNTKNTVAVRTSTPPKIDGRLDDVAWQNATVAGDFIQYTPVSGKAATLNTEVRVVYDDNAIYFGAFMHDPNPDSIYTDLGKRDSDRNINADVFSIDICPYNDGINGYSFKISASGVQTDGKQGGGNEPGHNDNTWDAVWQSSVTVTEDGWIAELKIPYSALRFPKTELQKWGINFWREVRRTREQSSWNYVNKDIGTIYNHLGELSGISEIKPPLRLSVTPYVSGYLETNSDEKGVATSYNGGLDIKYGINESFTLDATLIPDFGQVQSDDQVLNLTPYEVKYNEKRPFFMEGTELFNKGNIFYSRRIGSKPKGYDDVEDQLQPDESIVSNPQEASLINATKFSGRTRSGLGIGLFNAMTKEMFAEVSNDMTGEKRKIKTEPLTNYNMIVLDQSLRNNSFVSVANTNVWRRAEKMGDYYTANVTAAEFLLQNNSRLYSVSGEAAISQKYYSVTDDEFGHAYGFKAGKTGGAFRLIYEINALSDKYDPNDMGYLRRNNEFNNIATFSYNRNKPFWHLQSMRNSLTYAYQMLYDPRVFTASTISLSSFSFFMNYWTFNVKAEYNPQGINDYYEPRAMNRFYHIGRQFKGNISFDTNKNKILYMMASAGFTSIQSDYNQGGYNIMVDPYIKIARKLIFDDMLSYSKLDNDIGFVNNDAGGNIYFGKRNTETLVNTFSASYIFTPVSYLTFRLRHYWSKADYTDDYYLLMADGNLENSSYTGDHDSNYNAFNIDMVYTWRFAPGSEMTFGWKNAIYSYNDKVDNNYGENLSDMFKAPRMNSFSIKVLYYLDYQNVVKRK